MKAGDENAEVQGQMPSWYRDPVLWYALAVGLLLRGACLILYPEFRLTGDQGMHYVSAVLTSEFGPRVLGIWAPGYEIFLAAIFKLASPNPWNVLAVQVVISTGIVATIYAIARAAGGRRAGRIAACLTALYPSLIAYSNFFFSETLFLCLLTGAVCALYGSAATPGARRIALAGVLFGLAILTRSVVLWVLPVWALWLALRARPAEAKRVAVVFVIALATVLPWTIRNWVKYDGFLLVDGTIGRTFYLAYSQNETTTRYGRDLGYEGGSRQENRVRVERPTREIVDFEPLPPATDLVDLFPEVASRKLMPAKHPSNPLHLLLNKIEKGSRRASLDLVYRQSSERSAALEYAMSHPDWVLSQSLDRLYAFWGPTSFLLRSVHSEIYPSGPLSVSNYEITKWIVVFANVFLVAVALLALGRRGPPIQVAWGVVMIVILTALSAISEGNSRYRLPLMPFVIVMASVWLSAPHRPEGRARMATIILLEIAFVVFCGHYIATVLP